MHIPDGFLNNGVSTILTFTALVGIGYSLKKVRSAFLEKVPVIKAKLAAFPNIGGSSEVSFQGRLSKMGQEKIWRMATVGSLIFAGQMVNFPIADGTSGHLLGGVLSALILGPFEALIVVSAVLGVQAIAFGDGGIIALGANIFNMGVIGAIAGYHFFKFLIGKIKSKKRLEISAFVSSWLSVIMAAIFTSFEISLSGTESLSVVLPAMTEIHILIGLGEGIITVAILTLLLKNNFALAISEKNEE